VTRNNMKDRTKANGGLGDYYSENETRIPTWMVIGDKERVSALIGLSVDDLDGGMTDPEVVARWCDDGAAPNGLTGRAFNDAPAPVDDNGRPMLDDDGFDLQSRQSVHAFDCTIAAPKSVARFDARGLETEAIPARVEAKAASGETPVRRPRPTAEPLASAPAPDPPTSTHGWGRGAPTRRSPLRLLAFRASATVFDGSADEFEASGVGYPSCYAVVGDQQRTST
jgi:hypothetical protein